MTPLTLILTLVLFIALILSVLTLRAGLGDIPDNRSNHSETTPTGGGLVIIGTIGLTFLLLAFLGGNLISDARWPQLLSLVWMVGFLGLIDDSYEIPAGLKFFILFVVCCLTVWVTGPVMILPYAAQGLELYPWMGVAGSILWLFVVINVVNFMDGSNGLMITVMGIAHTGLITICLMLGLTHIIWLSVAVLIGLIALLPFNFGHLAKIFSGDIGSLTTGYAFAVTTLWMCTEQPSIYPAFIGPVIILPFLADVLLTMLRRVNQRENLLEPHKSHIYQRLIAQGCSHVFIALLYGSITAFLAIYAYIMTRLGVQNLLSFLMMPLAVFLSTFLIVNRRLIIAEKKLN